MQAHCLTLSNREVLEATGVVFVNSFDDREVILTPPMVPCVCAERNCISASSVWMRARWWFKGNCR